MKLSNTLMINESLLPSSKKAFTLAEVLITLSILGVIAALTIPSLVNRYTDSAAQTKLRKAVADYEKFAAAYMAENEATDLSDLTCADLASYFKKVNVNAANPCVFTTSDGALWTFATDNGHVADAIIADSEKGPRYAVGVWTHFGYVNSEQDMGNGQGSPLAAATFPTSIAATGASGSDNLTVVNGYYKANQFLAADSKTLSKGTQGVGLSSISALKGSGSGSGS